MQTRVSESLVLSIRLNNFYPMSNIKLFQSKQIRTVWNEDDQKWYFSVSDVVQVLTDSTDIKQYIKKLRNRDVELNSYWGTICPPLEMIAKDGKRRKVICANFIKS